MVELPEIEIEGVVVVPKRGVYKCPFKCDAGSGHPPRTWKTEAGFRKHVTVCAKSPSAIRKQQAAEEKRQAEYEQRKADALSRVTQQVGDEVFWVQEVTVKDCYEQWGNRRVRVRYEPIKRFDERRDRIESINFDNWGGVYFNHPAWMMTPHTICASMEDARAKAKERQKAHDEWCAEAARCR